MPFPQEVPASAPEESQVLTGMWDARPLARYEIDLRPQADDKTVLRNPHKGWFFHYVDNGFHNPTYRDQHPDGDFLEDFPGMNHLYLRFDWSDIEPARGVYDFRLLDEIIEKWAPHGYRFQLRMCAFEASTTWLATPAYVFEDGARCYKTKEGTIQPDYGDPIFLDRLEKALEALGKRYNGDPLIELVDIGTYGTWGEGHTFRGDGVIYPTEVIKKHFDLHARYFPDTFLLCNDDHIAGRIAHGQAEVMEMLEYAESRGFGLQDDSICVPGYVPLCPYDTMRATWAFDRLYPYAPSCIEFAHYRIIRDGHEDAFKRGFPCVEALKNSHATFAGFHGYPRLWLENEGYLTEYCANRLGYWFFLPKVYLPPMQNTAHNAMRVTVENRGWGKAYHPYRLRVRFAGTGGAKVVETAADVRTLTAGDGKTFILPLDLRGLPAGTYTVSVGLFEGEKPVRLALAEDLYDHGFYRVGQTTVSAV